ncbi:hypothetical protein QVD17_39357 [Tagetes erecta]|uniref:Uncharacterized protein n=1 Tax=Tagetes erecta TaxID=13708 RepID=A0AAD8NH20_TARER|nr:hypothetical protein QVD17_39357 [Tagetes erecta]
MCGERPSSTPLGTKFHNFRSRLGTTLRSEHVENVDGFFRPNSECAPRRLWPTDDEKNEAWWIQSCAYIQEMVDEKMKSTSQNVGSSKDGLTAEHNFEFNKVSSLDDNEFIEDDNFDVDNINFKQQEDLRDDLQNDFSNINAEDMRTPANQSIQSIQLEPRRRKGKRQRFSSRYYVTHFRPFKNTPRMEKEKNKYSVTDSELLKLCQRSYYWIWSTLLQHYAIDGEFWRLLLGKQAGGWLDEDVGFNFLSQ